MIGQIINLGSGFVVVKSLHWDGIEVYERIFDNLLDAQRVSRRIKLMTENKRMKGRVRHVKRA